jgi:hypothetical protein
VQIFATDNVQTNSGTLSMFPAEFVEIVLGVPELLENGQRPDVVGF